MKEEQWKRKRLYSCGNHVIGWSISMNHFPPCVKMVFWGSNRNQNPPKIPHCSNTYVTNNSLSLSDYDDSNIEPTAKFCMSIAISHSLSSLLHISKCQPGKNKVSTTICCCQKEAFTKISASSCKLQSFPMQQSDKSGYWNCFKPRKAQGL